MSMSRIISIAICSATLSFSCGCSDANRLTEERAGLSRTDRVPPTALAAPAVPVKSQLAAAHILIMHTNSARCPPSITRTKEEALSLAQEVAAKAQFPDTDFANLAKEYSDGPSGPKGGDLGAFKPGDMVKPFSDATMELEIGAVSDPVETRFGYHIILRKEP